MMSWNQKDLVGVTMKVKNILRLKYFVNFMVCMPEPRMYHFHMSLKLIRTHGLTYKLKSVIKWWLSLVNWGHPLKRVLGLLPGSEANWGHFAIPGRCILHLPGSEVNWGIFAIQGNMHTTWIWGKQVFLLYRLT